LTGTKEFTLTGSAEQGWILGEVKAYDILSFFKKNKKKTDPIIYVSKGDQVVLKLRSSDVTHGFSLKAFGIFISKGIEPGQTVYVKFIADKTGTFIFACNVYCGDIHHMMHGSLIVTK
jgi:heme/copper-type cytochrome/quinol oxidase subunit 2